ncbi:Rieske 2Fe-2S domain-containing protein [Leptolyngbya sp. AN02str]|uniref:aromatic ring-hydroxylating dioxygenase subunit alpha n=1 Tax=Leptolyngbya sp. AN02str TaxID=3423363 RepID=UPI003D31C540
MDGIDPVVGNDWYVVGRSRDIAAGMVQLVRLLGQDLVLWRSASGDVSLWRDRCPHRSVRLSVGHVSGNTLVCAYHGMAFGTDGQCVSVPAHPGFIPPNACAQPYPVQERYGLIYTCLGTAPAEIPPFLEWDDPAFRCFVAGPYPIQANGLRAIENFLDVAHFPFLHEGILGDRTLPHIEPYDVTLEPDGVHARNIRVWQPDPIGTGEGAQVTYHYWAMRPLAAYLQKLNPTGESLTILLQVTPVDEVNCIAWMLMGMNTAHEVPEAELVAFQDGIVQQDLANLQAHNPQALPLEGGLEFHVPSDRTSVFYRKWLKQLGLTYGVWRSPNSLT